MLEYEKYQDLQAKSQKMQEDYERQLQEAEEQKEQSMEELTEHYETKVQEKSSQLEQVICWKKKLKFFFYLKEVILNGDELIEIFICKISIVILKFKLLRG